MAGIFFYNADGATYQQYLDDTIWEMIPNLPSRGYWDGTKWVDTSGYPHTMVLIPKSGSTWEEDFRPTHLRISGTVGGISTGVALRDQSANNVGQMNTQAVGVMELTWGGSGPSFDIHQVLGLQLYGYTTVTNIEFLGG